MKIRLLEKYRNNELTEEELKEFVAMIRESGDKDLSALLGEDMERFVPSDDKDDSLAKSRVFAKLQSHIGHRKPREVFYKVWSAVAAVLLPIFAVGGIYYYINWQHDSQIATTIRTEKGRLATVDLPDSSHVTINSRSNLHYSVADFTKRGRHVNFEGEAFFEVARNEGRPFVIHTKELDVTVHGTTFNLKAYDNADRASLSLLEGSVTMTAKKTEQSIRVQPGQTATFDYKTGSFSVSETEANDNLLAWRDGLLRFNSESLPAIVSKIEEVYNCEITYSKPATDERFTGAIPMNNISSAIAILENIYKTEFHVAWK